MLIDPHQEEVVSGALVRMEPHEPRWFQMEIPISVSLGVVGGIILLSVLLSLLAAWLEKRSQIRRPPGGGTA